MTSLEEVMSELVNSQSEFAKYQTQFMEEIRATFQIIAAQLKSLEMQVGKMTRILLEDEKRALPIYIYIYIYIYYRKIYSTDQIKGTTMNIRTFSIKSYNKTVDKYNGMCMKSEKLLFSIKLSISIINGNFLKLTFINQPFTFNKSPPKINHLPYIQVYKLIHLPYIQVYK